jgi:hypothetical protein
MTEPRDLRQISWPSLARSATISAASLPATSQPPFHSSGAAIEPASGASQSGAPVEAATATRPPNSGAMKTRSSPVAGRRAVGISVTQRISPWR